MPKIVSAKIYSFIKDWLDKTEKRRIVMRLAFQLDWRCFFVRKNLLKNNKNITKKNFPESNTFFNITNKNTESTTFPFLIFGKVQHSSTHPMKKKKTLRNCSFQCITVLYSMIFLNRCYSGINI